MASRSYLCSNLGRTIQIPSRNWYDVFLQKLGLVKNLFNQFWTFWMVFENVVWFTLWRKKTFKSREEKKLSKMLRLGFKHFWKLNVTPKPLWSLFFSLNEKQEMNWGQWLRHNGKTHSLWSKDRGFKSHRWWAKLFVSFPSFVKCP